MATSSKNHKRSHQVDKLVNEVDRLVAQEDYSINRACIELGLQPTVYYYRKRKEDAIAQGNPPAKQGKPSARAISAPSTARFDASHHVVADRSIDVLKKEYQELEMRLQAIRNKIAEKVLGNGKDM